MWWSLCKESKLQQFSNDISTSYLGCIFNIKWGYSESFFLDSQLAMLLAKESTSELV